MTPEQEKKIRERLVPFVGLYWIDIVMKFIKEILK